MDVSRFRCIWCLAALLAVGLPAVADELATTPHIGYVYPAGAQQGTEITCVVGGQLVKGADTAYVSGQGVTATVAGYATAINEYQYNHVQSMLTKAQQIAFGNSMLPELNDAAAWEPLAKAAYVSPAELEVYIAYRLDHEDLRRQTNAQLADKVKLDINVSAHAAPGPRELRIMTPVGLSNPIPFVIGKYKEFDDAQKPGSDPQDVGQEFPLTINGQILPGRVDRFSFTAKKGQHLVIQTSARELMPYLADAVPGWFQAALRLCDDRGTEIAFADHTDFHPDPAMSFTVPQDGKYTLEICDALYRGRDDFVYRITIGELPFIKGIYPLGGPTSSTKVQLIGWNIPAPGVAAPVKDPRTGSYHVSLASGDLPSNDVPFVTDTLPEINVDGSAAGAPMSVTLPVVVNGRIAQPGETDSFRFQATAGTKIVAEVTARRLGSPLDSVLTMTDDKGKAIAFNDDTVDLGSGQITNQTDSYLNVAIPATGRYTVRITDSMRHGGPEYAYRLRLSEPRPDFALRIVPSSLSAPSGGTAKFKVYAIRRDGFAGEIKLALTGAPNGFKLSGNLLPARTASADFALTVPRSKFGEPVVLHMVGHALIDDKTVVHDAVPAEYMMQAFAYMHFVTVQQWMVAETGRSHWDNIEPPDITIGLGK